MVSLIEVCCKDLVVVTANISILIKLKVDKFPELLWTFLKVEGGAKSVIKFARNM